MSIITVCKVAGNPLSPTLIANSSPLSLLWQRTLPAKQKGKMPVVSFSWVGNDFLLDAAVLQPPSQQAELVGQFSGESAMQRLPARSIPWECVPISANASSP